MLMLGDADIFTYHVACSYDSEDFELARYKLDYFIENLVDKVQADDVALYLTGKNNFRKEIYPEYKNQRPKERPRHWQSLREHLVSAWQAEVIDNMEADDKIGIELTKHGIFAIHVGQDKDILQVPGNHMIIGNKHNNYQETFHTITEDEGWYRFYQQVLQGDPIDNCPGAKGIGKAKARKILEATDGSKDQMFQVCKETYESVGHTEEYFNQMCGCLYILREEGKRWNPPV